MGPVIFVLGVLLAGVGAALAFLDIPLPPLPEGVTDQMAMWGALGAGGLLTVIGAVMWILDGRGVKHPPARPGEPSVDVDQAMMLRAIFTVAAADGDLGDSEIEMIGLVTEQILERRMSRHAIRKSFEEFRAMGETNVTNPAFDDAHSVLTPESAYAALKAATIVAFSDGDFQDAERGKLAELATRLGLGADKLDGCIAEARAAYGDVAGAPPAGA